MRVVWSTKCSPALVGLGQRKDDACHWVSASSRTQCAHAVVQRSGAHPSPTPSTRQPQRSDVPIVARFPATHDQQCNATQRNAGLSWRSIAPHGNQQQVRSTRNRAVAHLAPCRRPSPSPCGSPSRTWTCPPRRCRAGLARAAPGEERPRRGVRRNSLTKRPL